MTTVNRKKFHGAIAGWISNSAQQMPQAALDRALRSKLMQKRLRLLDKIFRAAEKKGLVPQLEGPRRFQFMFEKELIRCELREAKILVTRTYSGVERRVFVGSETFTFVIHHNLHRELSRVEWAEKKIGSLEKVIPEIIDALLMAGPVLKQRRIASEKQHENWQAARVEQLRQQDLLRKEHSYLEALITIGERHRTAVFLRQFMSVLEQRMTENHAVVGGRSIADWFIWAKHQLDNYDPLSGDAQTLFAEIVKAAER